MRFALLGDHPDGLDVTRAFVDTGRHELAVYAGPLTGAEQLARWGLHPPRVGDLEEVLADPAIDAVIVATPQGNRPAVLRRALQSERHVLCVHPADRTADIAFEAALLQSDTGCVLLPLLPEALHPVVCRFAELARAAKAAVLLEVERCTTDAPVDLAEVNVTLSGWDVLRAIGGEIGEVFAMAAAEEEARPGDPLLVSGRFVSGLLFRITHLAGQREPRWRLTLVSDASPMTLEFPEGWPGPARLTYTNEAGEPHVDEWPAQNPWLAVVESFEAVLGGPRGTSRLSWQDELRSLELDDAVRRSIERRRSSTLDLQDTTEEASFKGTMTLAGCGLLWLSLVLLILAAWFPKLLWVIGPLFGVFLVLQALRWVIPPRRPEQKTSAAPPAASTPQSRDRPWS